MPGAYFGSDIFRDFANILDSWAATDSGQLEYFGGKSFLIQSHGQSLMSYFRSRFQIKGIYFLDEPEAALSPRSQLELLDIIAKNIRAGHAQFLIVTHSPILLACVNSKIYSFDDETVCTIKYEETDHYKIYMNFLLNRIGYQ